MDRFHFVLFEQEANTACQFGHDAIFAINHFGRIEAVYRHINAVFCKFRLGLMVVFRRLQQGFRRDTTHIQASTTQGRCITCFVTTCIDTSCFKTQLCCTNGRNIAARACADDYYIKLIRHTNPFIYRPLYERPVIIMVLTTTERTAFNGLA